MSDFIYKDKLLGNDYKAVFLCEHRRKVELTGKLIASSQKNIEAKHIEKEDSREGICYMFAKSIIEYAKAAYDNIILGHFDAANMVMRSMIENKVFLEIIYNDDTDELWKYYFVYSYRNFVMKNQDEVRQKDIDFIEQMYKKYELDESFYKNIGNGKPPIDKNYGWLYKLGKISQFKDVCKLVEFDEYMMYKNLCEYSHGTSIGTKMFSNTFIEHIVLMFENIYIILYNIVILFCDYNFDEEFDIITIELENIYHDFITECEEIYGN